jgi:glycosyltransferase involved in cell wall biosynthesis
LIRVGFINIFAVREWLGGLNYLRNLLLAVCALENRHIEPVFITGHATDADIAGEFSFVPTVRTSALDRGRALWYLRKVIARTLGSDLVLRAVLSRNDIAVLSHSGDLGRATPIPSIAWIPDLQHRHLAHLFSDGEITARERNIARGLEANVRVIVSSETAASHLRSGAGDNADKIRVLRFVSGLLHGAAMPARGALQARYQIDGPYLLLPNQFWAHKNHVLVVDALRQINDGGMRVTVLATGLMQDPRQPAHVAELMEKVSQHGLTQLFRPLGVVPYADMLGLMRDSVGVINPSLFEGWSSSVEEAKSMGKAVMLSDIPVHVEQAPARGIYFDPHDADAAANALLKAWSGFDEAADQAAMSEAARQLPARLSGFAEDYQSIVIEALAAAQQ